MAFSDNVRVSHAFFEFLYIDSSVDSLNVFYLFLTVLHLFNFY